VLFTKSTVDYERIQSRKLDQLDSIQQLEELKVPPGNRLEKFSGNRKAEYSIRINEQYRICFIWGESGLINVEVTDYH
jgi:proteic killer suppression protein